MTQIESLLEELTEVRADLKKFEDRLNDHTHDVLSNRIDMLESMLEMEGYYA